MADEKLIIENLPKEAKVIYKKSSSNGITKSFAENKTFNKFKSAYEELTGEGINWKDIPKNLQNSLLTSKMLSAKEIAHLPKNIRVAYLVARKPPDNVLLNEIRGRLISYESKYGISSEDFYEKYHNSEKLYEGSPEQVNDFLLWHGDYRRYLELRNAIR